MQDSRANIIMTFCFALLSNRIRGMMPHFHAYPLGLAALLNADSVVVDSALKRMKECDRVWTLCNQKGLGLYWLRIQRRSYMNYSYNRVFSRCLAR